MITTQQQTEKDSRYSLRTQISLSPNLRRLIEQKRAPLGESLSEYIRKAIAIRARNEESTEEVRMKAIKAFIGSGSKKSYPHWNTDKKIRNWQRMMRQDPPRLAS